MRKVKVGIVGCGNISGIYLKNCSQRFEILEVVACADLVLERAQARAKEFDIPKVCSVEELLADPEIDIVVNLTVPKAHAQICIAALEAGKNVYVEKPLAITREEGKKILDIAKAKGLLVGCAPDTFLGAGLQTCRKLIDDGWIGEPVAATAFMVCHGHESWHPDPEFYYQVGGGPMFDMGPYYLTALISLIGPIRRVTASARITFPERTITSQPKYGTKIKVETPTHIAGIMDFENGAVGTIITSFDIWNANLPRIEIYGSEGTLSVPDPNTFGGPVLVRRQGASEWKEIPLTHGYADNSRGIGVADMAYALLTGRPHRANGEMAYHVLDVMQGFLDASERGSHYLVHSSCSRPAPLPLGLSNGVLDK
ncbi:putative dehydrogenase [Caldicoprobacter guelmensis]|uniref:Gfo/Idh/MocA family protein n=1 Tax=Caldicoprobacter guelmensis TaxID=1170224 RepID=UPI00195D843A|nr:Gfo/Idh/MocA family oxidoreductase [Caldicoprobacter guelmensis]MBM7582516.1 putative dehydrogenase [Caldicoprobacter guelmensis]